MKHHKKGHHMNHQGHSTHHVVHHRKSIGQHLMENKPLIIAIVVVFVLVVITGVYFTFFNYGVRGNALKVSEQCASFCQTEQKAAFCDVDIRVTDKLRATCQALATESQYAEYGVIPCGTISCVLTAEESDNTCVVGLGGVWETPVGSACPAEGDALRFVLSATDDAPTSGQICCTAPEFF